MNNKKIKIIILVLNFKNLPRFIQKVLIDIEKTKKFNVIQVIELGEKKRSLFYLKILNRILLKFLLYIENKKIKENKKQKKINIQLKNYILKKITPIRTKYSDYFKTAEIKKIKKLKPDIILNFSDRLIKGKILKLAKYGMIGFHYSDINFQRNGLGGFYEIIYGEKYSGVTLQRYNEKVDGGDILCLCKYKTQKYFITNHKNLLSKTSYIFQKFIKLVLSNKLKIKKPKTLKVRYLQHPPKIIDIFKYIFIAYF